MLFSLIPWVFFPPFLLFDIFADILTLPISYSTLWIDLLYDIFVVVDFFVDIFLGGYYLFCFTLTAWYAMRDRDMYDTSPEDE